MFSRNSLGMILNFSMHSDWELVMLCSPDRKHGSHLVPNELAQPVISSVEKEERTADICEVLQTCSLWKLAERRFSHWKSLSESPVRYPGTSTCLWIDILYHGKGKYSQWTVESQLLLFGCCQAHQTSGLELKALNEKDDTHSGTYINLHQHPMKSLESGLQSCPNIVVFNNLVIL